MSESGISNEIVARIANSVDDDTFVALFSPDGLARTCEWEAEDGWIVSYTTTRVKGGRLDGLFAVFLYRPVGKGSKGGRGKAQSWDRVKLERCKTRREARGRAETYYYAHSPNAARRHGRTSV